MDTIHVMRLQKIEANTCIFSVFAELYVLLMRNNAVRNNDVRVWNIKNGAVANGYRDSYAVYSL